MTMKVINADSLSGAQFQDICRRYGYTMEIVRVGHFDAYLHGTAGISKTPYPRHIYTKYLSYEYCRKIFDADSDD